MNRFTFILLTCLLPIGVFALENSCSKNDTIFLKHDTVAIKNGAIWKLFSEDIRIWKYTELDDSGQVKDTKVTRHFLYPLWVDSGISDSLVQVAVKKSGVYIEAKKDTTKSHVGWLMEKTVITTKKVICDTIDTPDKRVRWSSCQPKKIDTAIDKKRVFLTIVFFISAALLVLLCFLFTYSHLKRLKKTKK
jgi:hypothetical protein